MNYISGLAERIKQDIPESALPATDVELLFLLYAVLLLAKGTAVESEDVHNAWTAWMTACGEQHESMVPFADLPESVKREDEVFLRAIRRVAVDLRDTPPPIR